MDSILPSRTRRRGRVAEGGGLLNRYTPQRRIEGSNPSVSATGLAVSLRISSRIILGCELRRLTIAGPRGPLSTVALPGQALAGGTRSHLGKKISPQVVPDISR